MPAPLPRLGRLAFAIPPPGSEGRLTGPTLFGGVIDGRDARPDPPGFAFGRLMFGRAPPEGLKFPPPAGRDATFGREPVLGRAVLAIDGRFTFGRAAACGRCAERWRRRFLLRVAHHRRRRLPSKVVRHHRHLRRRAHLRHHHQDLVRWQSPPKRSGSRLSERMQNMIYELSSS